MRLKSVTVLLSTVFVFLYSVSARAQEQPRIELFGGYSYLGVVSPGFSSVPLGLQTDVAVNVRRWFSVEGDVNYNSRSGVGFLTVTAGPRFTFQRGKTEAFFHPLVGVGHLSVGFLGFDIGESALTFSGGAGLNVRVQKYVAIRAFEADFESAERFGNFVDGFRFSSGVVFTFGGSGDSAPRSSRQAQLGTQRSDQPRTQRDRETATTEAPLLGIMGYESDAGFKVTSVRPGSLGSQAGIEPTDVVFEIDGHAVHSNQDIEAALASSSSGTVSVKYLIKGSYSTEHDIKVR